MDGRLVVAAGRRRASGVLAPGTNFLVGPGSYRASRESNVRENMANGDLVGWQEYVTVKLMNEARLGRGH